LRSSTCKVWHSMAEGRQCSRVAIRSRAQDVCGLCAGSGGRRCGGGAWPRVHAGVCGQRRGGRFSRCRAGRGWPGATAVPPRRPRRAARSSPGRHAQRVLPCACEMQTGTRGVGLNVCRRRPRAGQQSGMLGSFTPVPVSSLSAPLLAVLGVPHRLVQV